MNRHPYKSGTRLNKICDVCGKEMLLLPSSKRKHCSWECYCKSRIGKKPGNFGLHYETKPRIIRECRYCKKEFRVLPSEKNVYCSLSCSQKDRPTEEEKRETIKKCNDRWNKSKKHRIACMKWTKEHPERMRIAQQTAWAFKTGKIKLQPCEVCGSEFDLQKHHPDYAKPLDIKWLCRKCHVELHKQIKRGIYEQKNIS